MSDDSELAAWRADWKAETPPVPQLDRWAEEHRRRVARDTVLGVVGSLAAVASYLLFMAVHPSTDAKVLGIVGPIVFCAGLVMRLVRARRFARPVPSTRDFVERAHERATFQLKRARWGQRLAWFAAPVGLAFGGWAWSVNGYRHDYGVGLAIGLLAGWLAVLVFGRRRRQRAQRELEEIERVREALL